MRFCFLSESQLTRKLSPFLPQSRADTYHVIVEEWKTNLMSLAILFHFLCAQHVSDINISIISSLRLCCWITTSVVLFSVRCVLEIWCGWVWVEWKTNLMSLAILFHFLCAQHVSDINISIMSSLRLCCWNSTSVVLFSVRCVLEIWCGLVWVAPVLQAEAVNDPEKWKKCVRLELILLANDKNRNRKDAI